jgi:hypothetical protein
VPALQVPSPEFKPQYHQKRARRNLVLAGVYKNFKSFKRFLMTIYSNVFQNKTYGDEYILKSPPIPTSDVPIITNCQYGTTVISSLLRDSWMFLNVCK